MKTLDFSMLRQCHGMKTIEFGRLRQCALMLRQCNSAHWPIDVCVLGAWLRPQIHAIGVWGTSAQTNIDAEKPIPPSAHYCGFHPARVVLFLGGFLGWFFKPEFTRQNWILK
jgi:hypothetical protein